MNEPKKLYMKGEYVKLSRDEMYKALAELNAEMAKGKSRAKKEVLIDAYQAAVKDYAEKLGASEVPPDEVVNEDDKPKEPKKLVTLGAASALMEATKDLPPVAGVADLERVNPPMPEMELNDGAVLLQKPDEDRLYIFRDGIERELTPREKVYLDRLQKNFDAFCKNPFSTDAKREALSAIYSLKTCGIITNPKFTQTIKKGRRDVKDFRKQQKAHVDPQVVQAQAALDKANEMKAEFEKKKAEVKAAAAEHGRQSAES